ncbi:MAG: secretion protein HlyD family protein, partial [Frankiales bacterium]|nr:secretion protein HlyD family protein [Frankiales bacterium]
GTGAGGTGGGGAAGGGPAGGTGAGSTGGGTSTSAGRTSTLSQAARVTLDEAAVVSAQVALTTAQDNLDGATLLSPMNGTVAAQPLTAGKAEATSDAITVIGKGAIAVTVNVPYSTLTNLKVKQAAQVTADGSTKPVAGSVAQISLLPGTTTTASGASTYPVTVLVPDPGSGFVDGGNASATVVIKSVSNVVTVPNSALSNGAVLVLTDGKAVRTPVVTGAVGPLTTEIVSGVTAGQTVVLADLTATLPANSTNTTRNFGGGGGPGGAGGPGGRQFAPGGGGGGGAPPAP